MSKRHYLIGGVVGAVAGSLITALATPKSGEEMREDIKEAPKQAKGAFFEKLGKEKAPERKRRHLLSGLEQEKPEK
jgi:gas vesicle protein